jgi:hypothetical protein
MKENTRTLQPHSRRTAVNISALYMDGCFTAKAEYVFLFPNLMVHNFSLYIIPSRKEQKKRGNNFGVEKHFFRLLN